MILGTGWLWKWDSKRVLERGYHLCMGSHHSIEKTRKAASQVKQADYSYKSATFEMENNHKKNVRH